MLFKQQNLAGTTVSLATGGHFTHIAFVYKDPTEESDIVYYESVMGGVGHSWWSDLRDNIGEGKFYEKVSFRKLKCKRDENFMKEIKSFITETYGMEYSLKNLMPGRSKTSKEPRHSSIALKTGASGKKKYVEDDRTFFCSEYVAKAYKVLGVFNTEENSSFFLPSTLEKDEII